MEKTNFKNLLVDLYQIYNPGNLQYIDDLVEKYSRIEFDAVKNIFLKYNRKSAPYYDAEVGTDTYIISLLKIYDSGARPLENLDLKAQIVNKLDEQKQVPTEESVGKS